MIYKPLNLVLNNCDIKNNIISLSFDNISNIKPRKNKKKLNLKLGLRKNFSTLTTTNTSLYKINNDNNKEISLFRENNPFHFKLPMEQNSRNKFSIFSDRKKLMDSIKFFSQNSKFKSSEFHDTISELMEKYSYSNPDSDTTKKPIYEITKSKINFYLNNKKKIKNFLLKSKSSHKFTLHNLDMNSKLGYDEEKNSTKIKLKNMEYQGPIDSLGLLLRNKIVHDKILLNYQDREVINFGKTINKINNLNKLGKYNKKIKITPIIPTILDNDLFNFNFFNLNSKNLGLFNENETNKNINKSNYRKNSIESKIFLDINDFIKGSVYLLCKDFKPIGIYPESRENFCMNYDPLSNSIYIFSGNSCNIRTNHIWKFNNNNCTWSCIKSNNNDIQPRSGHTGIFFKNKYYIFGGKFLYNDLFARLDIFNFDTNTWLNTNSSFIFFKLRRNHISCLIGPQMFIHGGIGENGEYLGDSYLLNLNNSLIWNQTNILPISIPPKLAYHSCCLVMTSDIVNSNKYSIYKIPNKLNNKIKEKGLYVFGGKNNISINNDMWLLRIGKKALEWVKLFILGKSPCPRYSCSMNFFEKGNYIIIHGGKTIKNEENVALNDTYLFELYRYEWIRVDYGEKEKNVRPRFSHNSVICGNKLFIFGGINDETYVGGSFFIINLDINKAKESLIIKKNMLFNRNQSVSSSIK